MRWGLTVDTSEKDTLTTLAQGCPNVPLPATAEQNGR